MGSNFETLRQVILDGSEAKTWHDAVAEWDITGYNEDTKVLSSCACGKRGLRYLYQITNRETGSVVYPIGSCCIKKFGRKDLANIIGTIEERLRLGHAIENGKYLDLRDFSRKLLAGLWEDGAFVPNAYNGYDGRRDYQFLLDMFNKRSGLTLRQQGKVTAILLRSVKPYLERTMKQMHVGMVDC